MKPFGFSLVLVGLFGAMSLTSPVMSAPIAGLPTAQLNSMSTMPDEAQAGSPIVQVRFGRGGGYGGYRGGGMHRHHGVYRGGGYRYGGVVHRRAYIPGAYYGGGYCDPSYQYCGGGGVYRGARVYRGGGVYRGRAAFHGHRGHVSHYRGCGRRR
jgi:hypothetical protein